MEEYGVVVSCRVQIKEMGLKLSNRAGNNLLEIPKVDALLRVLIGEGLKTLNILLPRNSLVRLSKVKRTL